MLEKIKSFLIKLNEKGIPVPLIKDRGCGSVSLTLLFLSSLYVQASLINNILSKVFKINDTVDVANSLYWFSLCSALYFGRKITKDGNKVTVEKEDIK